MTSRVEPWLGADVSPTSLADQLMKPIKQRPRGFRPLFLAVLSGTFLFLVAAAYTVTTGIGVWGNNIPVAWAFGIINFVWWIGIGHAGTFISAILLLLEQPWRSSISRIAEGMTLFALVQAAMFPLLHLGRPWFFYWLVPYPNTMGIWPQFISALTWDIAAVLTYFTISAVFFYLGMLPDLAMVRDRTKTGFRRRVYAVAALGWHGSARHWRHYRVAQLLLAGLATPLVVSVHSIVSTDFAISKLPGWHSTIFPPYFVAGAIFSGFAMVLMIVIPLREWFGLKSVITARHLDLMAKMMLVTGLIVAYSYLIETLVALRSGDRYEQHMFLFTRPRGQFAFFYWAMIACNVVVPQLLWFRPLRVNPAALWVVALFVQLGMWLERFVLIVTSQSEDFLPSSFGSYTPSIVDGAILLGTCCLFSLLLLLLFRSVPVVPVAETEELLHETAHAPLRAPETRHA